MKAVVANFNQEKALVGAFSVIVQLHRLIDLRHYIYHLCPSSALLEVAMARLAKYIWSSAGDSQARVAIVPSSLVTHLAERYGHEERYGIQCS